MIRKGLLAYEGAIVPSPRVWGHEVEIMLVPAHRDWIHTICYAGGYSGIAQRGYPIMYALQNQARRYIPDRCALSRESVWHWEAIKRG